MHFLTRIHAKVFGFQGCPPPSHSEKAVMHSKACQAQLNLPFYNVGTTLLLTTTVWLGDTQKMGGLRVGPFLDP